MCCFNESWFWYLTGFNMLLCIAFRIRQGKSLILIWEVNSLFDFWFLHDFLGKSPRSEAFCQFMGGVINWFFSLPCFPHFPSLQVSGRLSFPAKTLNARWLMQTIDVWESLAIQNKIESRQNRLRLKAKSFKVRRPIWIMFMDFFCKDLRMNLYRL